MSRRQWILTWPRSSRLRASYGRAALDRALIYLHDAPVGQRNHTLNRCAFIVARYVAAGHLLEGAARAELTQAALTIGLMQWETDRTIESAFRAVQS